MFSQFMYLGFNTCREPTHASSTGQCILQAFKCLEFDVAETFGLVILILDDFDIFDWRRCEVFRDDTLVDIEGQIAYKSYVRRLFRKGKFLARRVCVFWTNTVSEEEHFDVQANRRAS